MNDLPDRKFRPLVAGTLLGVTAFGSAFAQTPPDAIRSFYADRHAVARGDALSVIITEFSTVQATAQTSTTKSEGAKASILQPDTITQGVGADFDSHFAGALADVDDAEFTTFQERLALRGRRLRLLRQAQRLAGRHRAADHEALVVGVIQRDGIFSEQAIHQITFAQLVVAGAVHHFRMRGVVSLLEHGIPLMNAR